MSAASNVAIFTANRDLFEEVRLHNLAVIVRRIKGGDYSAAENQYRNAFAEAPTIQHLSGGEGE
jgi:hypothetical protein